MQYDGSINIDTRVDTKGMNKGTKSIAASMGNVLKSIKAVGAALGLAFSGRAVINFIKKTLESFDLMSSAVGDEIKQVKDAFEGLKGALANTVLTLFVALQPYIIAAVQWLTQMLNTLTAIISALFGVQDLTGAAAENTGDMNKNAKGALASFDQINVLGGGSNEKTKSVLPNVTIPPELLAKVEDFKNKMLAFLEPVISGIKNLYEVLKPFAIEIYESLIKPFAEWASEKLIDFINWLGESLNTLATWIRENPEKFREFAIILGIIALAAAALAAIIYVLAAIIYVVATIFASWTAIVSVATAVIALITSPIFLIIAALAALVVAVVGTIGWFMYLKRSLPEIWEAIKSVWAEAGAWFRENVTGPIREAFAGMLLSISTIFIEVFSGIREFVITMVNDIIGIVNNAISGIFGGLLGATGNLGIGLVSGNDKTNNTLAIRVPRLATGAVIPPNSEFAAILGDQRGGRNLEAPEGLIRQIIREEMDNGNNGTITVQMPVYLDSEKVYDGVKKVEIRRGPSLVGGSS